MSLGGRINLVILTDLTSQPTKRRHIFYGEAATPWLTRLLVVAALASALAVLLIDLFRFHH